MNAIAQAPETKTVAGLDKSIFEQVLEINKATAAYCRAELATAVLDGSPFLLVITQDGFDRAYGHHNDIKSGKVVAGFLSLHALPDHLCGAMLYSPETGKLAAAAMNERNPNYNARLMHRREFTKQRLAMAEQTIAKCNEFIASLN